MSQKCDKVGVLGPCNDLSLIKGDINTTCCPVSKINKAERTGGRSVSFPLAFHYIYILKQSPRKQMTSAWSASSAHKSPRRRRFGSLG